MSVVRTESFMLLESATVPNEGLVINSSRRIYPHKYNRLQSCHKPIFVTIMLVYLGRLYRRCVSFYKRCLDIATNQRITPTAEFHFQLPSGVASNSVLTRRNSCSRGPVVRSFASYLTIGTSSPRPPPEGSVRLSKISRRNNVSLPGLSPLAAPALAAHIISASREFSRRALRPTHNFLADGYKWKQARGR